MYVCTAVYGCGQSAEEATPVHLIVTPWGIRPKHVCDHSLLPLLLKKRPNIFYAFYCGHFCPKVPEIQSWTKAKTLLAKSVEQLFLIGHMDEYFPFCALILGGKFLKNHNSGEEFCLQNLFPPILVPKVGKNLPSIISHNYKSFPKAWKIAQITFKYHGERNIDT